MYIAIDIDNVGTHARPCARILSTLPPADAGLLSDAAPPYEVIYDLPGGRPENASTPAVQDAIAALLAAFSVRNGAGREALTVSASAGRTALDRLRVEMSR